MIHTVGEGEEEVEGKGCIVFQRRGCVRYITDFLFVCSFSYRGKTILSFNFSLAPTTTPQPTFIHVLTGPNIKQDN